MKRNTRRRRRPMKNKPRTRLVPIMIIVGAAVLIALVLIVVFGEHGTRHMLPTITAPEAIEEASEGT